MKLSQYLDDSEDAEVQGYCRHCHSHVTGKRYPRTKVNHATYFCPKCFSINLRIDLVTEPCADGQNIVIYER